jgi:hypothetical protein
MPPQISYSVGTRGFVPQGTAHSAPNDIFQCSAAILSGDEGLASHKRLLRWVLAGFWIFAAVLHSNGIGLTAITSAGYG